MNNTASPIPATATDAPPFEDLAAELYSAANRLEDAARTVTDEIEIQAERVAAVACALQDLVSALDLAKLRQAKAPDEAR
jgi:hypothetical protein